MDAASHSLTILLVDDSEDDILLAQRVFAKLELPHKLEVAMSAAEALDYLDCKGKYAGRRKTNPDLLLLDINMPGMDGLELLKKLKADKELRKIPAIMLTSSASQADIKRSFESGAASFITKPSNFEGYRNLMSQFTQYWRTVSCLPQ